MSSKDKSKLLSIGSNGNESYCAMTQDEVAKALGISQMRVSQLERSALYKLRLFFLEL